MALGANRTPGLLLPLKKQMKKSRASRPVGEKCVAWKTFENGIALKPKFEKL